MLDWQGCTRAHVCAAPPTMVMLISSAPHWIEGESVGTVTGVYTQRARVLPFTVRAPLRGRLCTGSDSLDDGAAHNALARTLHGYRRAADERHLAGIGPVRVRGGIVRVRTYMSFLHSAPTWPCPHQSDLSAPTQRRHPLSLPLTPAPARFFPQLEGSIASIFPGTTSSLR